MRIGILGGTFNPVHQGHLQLAREVKIKCGLDEILLIPSGIPPHKTEEELATAEDRLEMVRLAIEGIPGLSVSDIEIRRPEQSYTIDTVRELLKTAPGVDFYFIIGLDAFLEIETWKEAGSLLKIVSFIVVSRPEYRFIQLGRLPRFSEISRQDLERLDNQQIERLDLTVNQLRPIVLLRVEPCPVSSSDIREKVRQKAILDNNH